MRHCVWGGVHDSGVTTECCKPTICIYRGSRLNEWLLEFWGAVERIHRIGVPIDIEGRRCNIITDKLDAPGNGIFVDISCCDVASACSEPCSDAGAPANPDFNHCLISVQVVDERRFRFGVHVGMFMNSGI